MEQYERQQTGPPSSLYKTNESTFFGRYGHLSWQETCSHGTQRVAPSPCQTNTANSAGTTRALPSNKRISLAL